MPGEASASVPARILIVDDEVGFRELMTFELESRGYKITTAENGEEGVKKAAREGFDAAVLDLTMPKMGGGGNP